MLLNLSVTCVTTSGVPRLEIPIELALTIAIKASIIPFPFSIMEAASLEMAEMISISARRRI